MTKVTTSIRMLWAALVSGGHLWCPVRGVNILHLLAVSVQKHHGATGLDHEAKKHGIRDEPQVAKACDIT